MRAGAELAALQRVIERFEGRRILVVGDVMLDHFVFGQVDRVSPEAPVPVVHFRREELRLGGAANVAHNLRAYGAEVMLVGLVGQDDGARQVRAAMQALGIATDGLVETGGRPTTRKMRIVTTRNQQVARVDYEEDSDATGDVEAQLIDRLHAIGPADAVVVSDYLKGVVTSGVMAALLDGPARRRGPVLVDPKIAHIDFYRGATVITPNHHEAEVATAMRIRSDADAAAAARAFRARAACDSVLITRGEHGIWVLEGDGATRDGVRTELSLRAVAKEVADVTGAGDTVIATLALTLAAGASLSVGAQLANEAAGISVSRFGPAAVARAELRAALTDR